MYEVLVLCSAGMSTSMLVEKIKKEIEKKEVNLNIQAVSITEGKFLIKKEEYDLLLLGPQVAFMKEQMEHLVNGKCPVRVINSTDYGMMNADNVLTSIMETLNNRK
ncbi:PTS sugar transporter subunit IIB [Anaerosalibacter massiliensis]|uniref:PTS sugar transporter subunit IIB n=1 Tax=Anaerosalibacter massiliensis TaxID=1347392 RepID=A0A9X2MJW8_9FIRM|nr:PTS sugar transporter subunit IIB [Anaerosalibacter massiliensis]MCR2044410.1 PTS sugar transporter subunit IIB [Anaerosalibacter massiliensis]